jgi:putative FmdB family regulatory protein
MAAVKMTNFVAILRILRIARCSACVRAIRVQISWLSRKGGRRNKMPFYDHVCLACGHEEINKRRRVDEIEAGVVCPQCGAKMQQKFDCAVNYILKNEGVGWSGDGYSKRRRGR